MAFGALLDGRFAKLRLALIHAAIGFAPPLEIALHWGAGAASG